MSDETSDAADDGSSQDVVDHDVPGSYQGTMCRIVQCAGALESLGEALLHIEEGKRLSMVTGLRDQMKRHADGGRMSNTTFPEEGPLPTLLGGQKGKKFRAYKRIPIRGYCWLSKAHPGTWFVSHYIYKNQTKLGPNDTQRVAANWRRIEEEGDER